MNRLYLFTTKAMILAMMVSYSTMRPLPTIYKYANGDTIFVTNQEFLDSLEIRSLCDTTVIDSVQGLPSDILYHKIMLNDSEML